MYTQDNLAGKTNKELVAIFNAIEGTQDIKRFSNVEVGIRRILCVTMEDNTPDPLAAPQEVVTKSVRKRIDAQNAEVLVQPSIQPVAEVAPVAGPKKRGRKRAERGFYSEPLGAVLRSCRASSGRGRLIEFLLAGATFEELRAQLPQWSEDQLHRHIRNSHFYLGYRLTTSDDGIIRAFTE
tara:strand:- start:41791 stop:42333 length:543 start_codon:yes stop_codon:yes gene_type:complete